MNKYDLILKDIKYSLSYNSYKYLNRITEWETKEHIKYKSGVVVSIRYRSLYNHIKCALFQDISNERLL